MKKLVGSLFIVLMFAMGITSADHAEKKVLTTSENGQKVLCNPVAIEGEYATMCAPVKVYDELEVKCEIKNWGTPDNFVSCPAGI